MGSGMSLKTLSVFRRQLGARARKWLRYNSMGQRIEAAVARSPDRPAGLRPIKPEDEAFAAFMAQHFLPAVYLRAYPDVAAAGIDPLTHWLEYGMQEQRWAGPNIELKFDVKAQRKRSGAWRRFTWRGKSIAARANAISEKLKAEISFQSRFEPLALAGDASSLAQLKQTERNDLWETLDVDSQGIFAALPNRPKYVFVLRALDGDASNRFAADIIGGLHANGEISILLFVTEHTVSAGEAWEKIAALAPLRSVRILFWPDFCAHNSVTVPARLLSALRPAAITIVNSRLGLDIVATFGAGLSQFTQLFCAYLGVDESDPYSRACRFRFPRKTFPHSIALTDNEVTASLLREQYEPGSAGKIAVLPRKLVSASDELFAARVDARRSRTSGADRIFRWALVFDAASCEGERLVDAIKQFRPDYDCQLFAVSPHPEVRSGGASLGGSVDNAVERELLDTSADYDGVALLDNSGAAMNLALGLAQQSIALIVPDTDGFRRVFDESSAIFAELSEDIIQVAAAFSDALDRASALTPIEATEMAKATRAHALRRHGPKAFAAAVASIYIESRPQ
jgi:hypothetical protein